jgi:hypothetical protein
LTRWLDECVSLGEVAHRMNEAGHQPRVVRGRDTGARTIWTTFRVREMLKRSFYYGQWLFGHSVDRRNPVWDTDQRRDRVKPIAVPELAYWTRGQVLNWQRKFAASPSGRAVVRMRTYSRPLIGVLACCTCRRPMIAAGKLGYQCPSRSRGGLFCEYAQTLSEKLATEKLRELLPEALREAAWFEDRARALAAESSTLEDYRSQAATIQARLDLSAQQWYGRQIPKTILDEMERDGIELHRLAERIAEEEARSLQGAEADETIRELLADPEGSFDTLPWEQQAWAYRLLFADVQMKPSGRGGGRRLQVTNYYNRITRTNGAPSDRRTSSESAGFEAGKTCRRAACRRG